MGITIRDVAEKCGLSISTVSKAFNNYSDIPEKTRAVVRRAAEEIGYHPSASARCMRTNRSYNLGVVFELSNEAGIAHAFFSRVLEGFKSESEKHGYDVTFISRSMSGMSYLEHCRYRNVDGIILVNTDFYLSEVTELLTSGINCITIDHEFEGVSSVLSANYEGMAALTQYALDKGHRNIAYIYGSSSLVSEKRVQGFIDTLAKAGIRQKKEFIIESDYNDPEMCYDRFMRIVRSPMRPSCVFLPDDTCAIGAMQAAGDAGLKIPDDISIAGYDGIDLIQYVHPRITTVRQNPQQMGMQAAIRLISQIENRDLPPVNDVVPVELVEGDTIISKK